MAATDSTPSRVAVDLTAPFGVHLGGVLLAEHETAQCALEFADRLRAGLVASRAAPTDMNALALEGPRLSEAAMAALDHLGFSDWLECMREDERENAQFNALSKEQQDATRRMIRSLQPPRA